MKSGKSFFEKNEMKKYRYRAPIWRMLSSLYTLLILIILYMILKPVVSSWTILPFLIVLAALLFIFFVWEFYVTRFKPRYIIKEEDKVIIPRLLSDNDIVFYERITRLEIWDLRTNASRVLSIFFEGKYDVRLFIEYTRTRYGKSREAQIWASWFEHREDFYEVYNAIKDKVNSDSCKIVPPPFAIPN